MTTASTATDGTLLVPIATSETADRLMDTATDIATDRSLQLLVIHVVAVPDQLPLDAGHRLLDDEDEQVLADAAAMAADHGVPAERRVRLARSVTSGILGAIEKYDVETTLLGWRGRPPRRQVVLGSYIDAVLRSGECDVLVKRIQTSRPAVESILVPVAGGPHDSFAAKTAGSIARRRDATVHLLHVRSADDPERTERDARALLQDATDSLGDVSASERELVSADHVAGAITDRTSDHDVALLGASRGGLLRRTILGTISEAVGRHAAGTVILAKRYESAPSRVRRLVR